MPLDAVDLLERLVEIPSVSPMRPNLPEGIVGEASLTTFLEKTLTRMGLTVWRQPVMPGRENLLARLDGDIPPTSGGRVILFDAHQDTVPVDGMTIEPFRPWREKGRIYGRGACDVKGGMAAMLAAIDRLARERPYPLPTVLVGCTVDEENGFRGVKRLTGQWLSHDSSFFLPRPDAVVVLEPTGLNVVVAHKGVIRWRIHTHGRAAHSSSPQSGENAIYKMASVVSAVEQYALFMAAGETHARCGHATISVGTIHGGTGVNTIPDRCTIEIDQRPLPNEELTLARQQLLNHIVRTAGEVFESEPPYMQGLALSDEYNRVLAEQLATVVGRVAGDCCLAGMSCCTNAPFYADIGAPTVVFGPGFLEQAHTTDEWISVDQLFQATEIVYRLCRVLVAKFTNDGTQDDTAPRT
jgi:acetylornithine deacetylase/succinyl-diaminopimelate desuccinylase-like protein